MARVLINITEAPIANYVVMVWTVLQTAPFLLFLILAAELR